MFHVKHILLFITFFYIGNIKAQGSISMSTNVITYNLPEDIGLRKTLASSNGYNSLSKDEQEVLYYLDYARKNPSIFLDRAINVFVTGHPEVNSSYIKTLQVLFTTLPTRNIILPDSIISRVSKSHAHDLESHQLISHNSSNGITFQQRVGPYLKNCGSEAIHASPRFTPLEAVLMLLFDFNVSDLGHRKALLNVNFTKAGLGVAISKQSNSILVIDFSCQ
jgi:hypothetical protein